MVGFLLVGCFGGGWWCSAGFCWCAVWEAVRRPEVLIVGGCDVLARVRVFWANLIGLVLLFGFLGLLGVGT